MGTDMSAWDPFFLPKEVMEALTKMGYQRPTAIQELVIPEVTTKRLDVLGAAETGSGKTMAFCIPIATRLLQSEAKEGLRALILAPTRELAVQIHKEMQKLLEFTKFRVIPIVGGLSQQKQERLLGKKPEVIVATPGRFAALSALVEYIDEFSDLDFLVIDEMDRMVETGHFAEMETILAKIHEVDNKTRQTLVFSATLSFVHLPGKRPDKIVKQMTKEEKIERLVQIGGLRKQHKVIDLNPTAALPSTLIETRMNCIDLLDKDTKVYYLLKRYSGRTIIFTNSIDASRRLSNLLKTLDVEPPPMLLHAKMQQRARMKHLDRFASLDNSVLIATDVAARGLDIKGIQNVIHYQIPKTAESYVHRSGRTARISNHGIAILMVDPKDANFYRRICKNLKKDDDFPVFEIDSPKMFKAAKERVYTATRVEQLEHRASKKSAKMAWMKKVADEADIELDEYSEDEREADHDILREKKAATKALKMLLKQPMVGASSSTTAACSAPPLAKKTSRAAKLLRKKNKRR